MDRAQQDTEALLKQVERRINKEYKTAIEEMEDQLHDYFERFEKKDETWRTWVENGTRTKEEYREWRYGQMAVGRRWQDQINSLAEKMAETNETAKGIVRKYTPEMYAENYNYSTYEIEKDAQIDTSFRLINKEAVERLMRKDPEVLPPPGKQTSKAIAEGKAIRWNRQQLQSVMVQGILQGDSITKLATRLANTVGDRNRKAAIRNARTMATGAQNAGRVDAYKRAQSKGVEMEQMWLATLDNRTRHSHRWLDREVRPVGEAFSNGCEYPGDPKGDPAEIYNCRCSLRGVVKGLERRSGKFRDDSAIKGMSYAEWLKSRSNNRNILSQDYASRKFKKEFTDIYGGNGIIKSRGDSNNGSEPDFFVGPNGKALPAIYKDWIGDNKMEQHLNEAQSEAMIAYIKSDFRRSSFIGDGSTAAIRKFEKSTGLNCGRNGGTHATKVEGLINQLNKKLKTELPQSDRIFMEEMLRRLEEVK